MFLKSLMLHVRLPQHVIQYLRYPQLRDSNYSFTPLFPIIRYNCFLKRQLLAVKVGDQHWSIRGGYLKQFPVPTVLILSMERRI